MIHNHAVYLYLQNVYYITTCNFYERDVYDQTTWISCTGRCSFGKWAACHFRAGLPGSTRVTVVVFDSLVTASCSSLHVTVRLRKSSGWVRVLKSLICFFSSSLALLGLHIQACLLRCSSWKEHTREIVALYEEQACYAATLVVSLHGLHAKKGDGNTRCNFGITLSLGEGTKQIQNICSVSIISAG